MGRGNGDLALVIGGDDLAKTAHHIFLFECVHNEFLKLGGDEIAAVGVHALGEYIVEHPLAALPMHQHISILNFIPDFLLILTRRLTSKILKNVTIGIGAFIQSSNAYARVVSLGFISLIVLNFIFLSFLYYKNNVLF